MLISSDLKTKLRTSKRIKVVIVLLTVLIITFFLPAGESIESEVKVGSIWIQDDLIASKTFEILKDTDQYNQEKRIAELKTLPIFLRNVSLETFMIDSISRFNQNVLNDNSLLENSFLRGSTLEFFKLIANRKIYKSLSFSNLLVGCRETLKDIYDKGYSDLTKDEIKRDTIALRVGRNEKSILVSSIITKDKIEEFLQYKVAIKFGENLQIQSAVLEYINHFLKPNIVYSLGLTEDAKRTAVEKVTRNIGIVNENERIVAKHDRISPETKLKIDSYRIAKGEERSYFIRILQNFGIYIHITLLFLPFIIYIYLFRKKIFDDNLKIVLIAIIVLFITSLAYIVNSIDSSSPIEYLILLPVASMLLTIIFDSRIGFYSTVVISLILGALLGNDYAFAATNIVAGGLAAYTVRDIKNRTQIFRSFLYILLGYASSIVAFGLERYQPFTEMLSAMAFAGVSSLISPVLTYGLIIFFERIFNITTDLTLLELTDLNRPLLKELAKNAPGTFSHSVSMGTLAETTAEAIGANSILARVGAYYHDVGKIADPDVFVENQIDTHNLHENLSPEKSRDLIIEHVKKGILLAEKNKLPKEIVDFIPMHHGNMVITFFYEKAKNLYGESNVNIDEYRYPGPKPNTKETAIVMLADACESTVRSIPEADQQIIENVINNLINSRIEDGQLDEAPLSFKDIKIIKESFLSILVGHHHRRIRYPNQNELETKGEE